MAKQSISAKTVLKDLRSGMSDADIREKYGLSEKGLQSLFKKLVEASVISEKELSSRPSIPEDPTIVVEVEPDEPQPKSQVADTAQNIAPSLAEAVLEDINSGMHEMEILRKRELTPSQLKSILQDLRASGRIPEEEASKTTPGRTIRCPKCSEEVPEMLGRCSDCGEWLRGAPPEPPEGSYEEEKECPFDNQEGYGFWRAYIQTATNSLVSPVGFFRRLPVSDGYKNPILFAVMSTAFSVPLGMTLLALFGKGPYSPGIIGLLFGFVCALFGAAIATPIILFLWSGLVHGALYLIGGATSGFQATFRVVSYSSVTQLFNAIPYLGTVASLYGLVLTAIGLRETHETSTGKGAAAVLISFAVVVSLGAILYIGAASKVASMMLGKHGAASSFSSEYSGQRLPDELCAAVQDYVDTVDSATQLSVESRQNEFRDAARRLQKALNDHRQHPNIKEVGQTCAAYLVAVQIKAAVGGNLQQTSPQGDPAKIKRKLEAMCGR